MKRIITLVGALIIAFSSFSQIYINEDFSTFTDSILPPLASGWKNIDSITPSANQKWRFDNPGGRGLNNSIITPAAVIDGDWYGQGNIQDAYLSSTNFDASAATVVTLQFDHVYRSASGSSAEIQIFDGSNWITDTIFTVSTDPTNGDIPKLEIIDISQYVAGISNAQVRFRFIDVNWGWYWIIDNVTVFQPVPDDAAVIAIDSLPFSACNLDSNETITARIVNFGSTVIRNIPIRYTINGGPIVPETILDSINPGDTLQYSFVTKANLSASGSYNLLVYSAIRGDNNNQNDSAFFTTTLNPAIATFPYSEGFENGNGAWVSGGTNNSWAVGAPAGLVINSAANGSNSYVTNLSGVYNNNEASYVLSPCFDFSTLSAPQFKMNIWYESEQSWDGTTLQMTIDDGITWTEIGAFGDPNNWFNDNVINGLQTAGLTGAGWTIVGGLGSGGWLLAEHDIPTAANEPSVRFRIFHGSDGSVQREGFAFDDILIQDAPAIDVGVVSFASPLTGCGLGVADSVCIMVSNYGSTPIGNFPIAYEFNGQFFTDTVLSTLNPGDTATFCFDSTINISTGGTYNIKAYSLALSDGNALNDTSNLTFDNIPIISGYPYTEGFENGNGGWVSDGSNSTWAIGAPTGAVINSAANGFNAYVTELAGQYNNNEESWVQGPCFDFTFLSQPQIKMNVWWSSEFSWDGAVLQSSINGGATWQKVGSFGDPNNWFTDNSINGLQTNIEPSGEGWSGTAGSGSGAWVRAEHDLTGLANQPAVILRVAFGSDGSVQDDGFAFDDVLIQDAPAIDAGVVALTAPVSGCGLSASDSVKVAISNFGSTSISNFPVTFEFNSSLFVDTFRNIINPGDTAIFTFTQTTVNLSLPGQYSFIVYTDLLNDSNLSNDTVNEIVNNIPIISIPYSENFESSNGGWTAYGTNSSWAWGIPTGVNINAAGSGIQAWVTNLTGMHSNNENSYLESPCMNFSGQTNDPVLTYLQTYNTEACCDEGWAELSINGGNTWTKLIDNGGAINWYNDIVNQYWNGNNISGLTAWDTVSNVLSGAAGQSSVKVRIAFSSDVSIVEEGFGVDSISIDVATSIVRTNSDEVEFTIYPNPNKGKFTLIAPKTKESINVEILDTKGKLVYSQVLTATSTRINIIDVSKTAKGIYFLRISNASTSKIEKLIVQ